MFSMLGCRRGFPREPNLCRAGPSPPHPHSRPGNWDEPPWEHQPMRGRGQWFQPGPWSSRRIPDPDDCPWNEEDGMWPPSDRPPPPHWGDEGGNQGPEDFFEESWHPMEGPGSWSPRRIPGPADFPWNEEDRRWAPGDGPPPPQWGDGERDQGPVDGFEESWHPKPLQHRRFARSGFHNEEQHPPWPPSSLPGKRGGFQDDSPPWGCHGVGRRRGRRLHRGLQRLMTIPCFTRPQPPRGYPPSSRSSYSDSRTSCPRVKGQSQHPDPPQPHRKDGAQSREPTAQGPPAASRKVPEPPKRASNPQKSPAVDPQAATEATELEQAAGATPAGEHPSPGMLTPLEVEPGAKQTPEDSPSQLPSASETEPALLEESSAGTGKHLEVEPCSQGVPEDGGSHPCRETAAPEPARRVCTAAGSAGGAELCLHSQEQQHLPSGAGEPNAEAPCDEPDKNSQVPPGATTEPHAQPGQACSNVRATPQTSPGTQHPPGRAETEPAGGSQCRLCSSLLTPSLASMDQRSAAVLARKEEIELSYQQFSLTIAVVATMLLQKEPSMEAALGVALRANLRQGRLHHLRKLEDFINSYDSATLKR